MELYFLETCKHVDIEIKITLVVISKNFTSKVNTNWELKLLSTEELSEGFPQKEKKWNKYYAIIIWKTLNGWIKRVSLNKFLGVFQLSIIPFQHINFINRGNSIDEFFVEV